MRLFPLGVIVLFILTIKCSICASDSLSCEINFKEASLKMTIDAFEKAIISIDSLNQSCDCCSKKLFFSQYYLSLLIRYNNDFSRYRNQLDLLDKLFLDITFDSKVNRLYYQLLLLYQRGVYYEEMKDLGRAKKLYRENLSQISNSIVTNDIIFALWYRIQIQLAIVEMKSTNFQKAIDILHFLEKMIVAKSVRLGEKANLYETTCQLANNYAGLRNTEKSLYYYEICNEESINILDNADKSYLQTSTYLHLPNVANEIALLLKSNEFHRSKYLIDKSKLFRQPDKQTNFYLDNLEARYMYKMGNMNDASHLFENLETKIKDSTATDQIRLAYYINKFEFEEIRENAQEQERVIDSLEKITHRIESATDIWTLNLLKSKKMTLKHYVDVDDKMEGLKTIDNLVIFLEEKLTKSMIFNDHVYLINEIYPTLESCLKFLYESKISDPDLVFRIIECTKALSLYKETSLSILSSRKDKSADLEKYTELKENLLILKTKDSKRDNNYDTDFFEANRALENLEEQIRSELTTNVSYPASLKTFQKSIENGHNYSLIFSGSDHYYILNLSSVSSEFERLDKTMLDNLIEKHTTEIQDYSHIKNTASKDLFNVLSTVMPLDQGKSLCISPDGKFQNITFGALMTSDRSNLNSKTTLYFTPSAHISLTLQNSNKTQNPNLGIFIPDNQLAKANLLFAKEEGMKIHELMGGKLAINQDCSKERFIQDARNYRIVHIATHATADTSDHLQSYISFTTVDSLANDLFLDEINSMTLNAELVTLSACETNVGQNFNGEGVQSLSRNFIAAGAKSVISSMWAVNDQTTSEIIISFYTYLKKGYSKAESLQKAKIDYLENNPGEGQHPYYWAGLVLTGNPDPIFPRPSKAPYYILASVLFVGIAYYGKKKLQKTAA